MENLRAAAHREERIEDTEKSVIQTCGTQSMELSYKWHSRRKR